MKCNLICFIIGFTLLPLLFTYLFEYYCSCVIVCCLDLLFMLFNNGNMTMPACLKGLIKWEKKNTYPTFLTALNMVCFTDAYVHFYVFLLYKHFFFSHPDKRVMVSCPGQYCGDIDDRAANEAAMYLLCL